MTLEYRMMRWVCSRIGADHMQPKERAMRLLEESIELAQAEGITLQQVGKQVEHVYSRPIGFALSEAAGVAVCLLAYCAARDTTIDEIARVELTRIEHKPIEQIRGSLARKADADLVTTVEPISGGVE
jgi:hypothetical protein